MLGVASPCLLALSRLYEEDARQVPCVIFMALCSDRCCVMASLGLLTHQDYMSFVPVSGAIFLVLVVMTGIVRKLSQTVASQVLEFEPSPLALRLPGLVV